MKTVEARTQKRANPPPPAQMGNPTGLLQARPGSLTHAQIAARAYSLWEEEGRKHGHDLEHWLRAEDLLRRTDVTRSGPAEPAGRPRPQVRSTRR